MTDFFLRIKNQAGFISSDSSSRKCMLLRRVLHERRPRRLLSRLRERMSQQDDSRSDYFAPHRDDPRSDYFTPVETTPEVTTLPPVETPPETLSRCKLGDTTTDDCHTW